MELSKIKPGKKVVTSNELKTPVGMAVKAEYIENRKAGAFGEVINFVPGHGGDVWFVKHEHGIAVYDFTELNEYARIVVQFPTSEMADYFAAQMSDGFGEGFCGFSFHRQKPGTKGDKQEDFERVKDELGNDVYFVDFVEGFDEENEEE